MWTYVGFKGKVNGVSFCIFRSPIIYCISLLTSKIIMLADFEFDFIHKIIESRQRSGNLYDIYIYLRFTRNISSCSKGSAKI